VVNDGIIGWKTGNVSLVALAYSIEILTRARERLGCIAPFSTERWRGRQLHLWRASANRQRYKTHRHNCGNSHTFLVKLLICVTSQHNLILISSESQMSNGASGRKQTAAPWSPRGQTALDDQTILTASLRE
jgi:hypothetical protein